MIRKYGHSIFFQAGCCGLPVGFVCVCVCGWHAFAGFLDDHVKSVVYRNKNRMYCVST